MTISDFGEVKDNILAISKRTSLLIRTSVTDSDVADAHGYIDASELLSLLPDTAEDIEILHSVRQQLSKDIYPEQNTLAAIRLSKGFTQRDLAELVGSPQPHIANIESGKVDVGRRLMNKLCDALNINMNELNEALKANDR